MLRSLPAKTRALFGQLPPHHWLACLAVTAGLTGLPEGWFLTLRGGMRWYWGTPFPFLEVHGDGPLTGLWSGDCWTLPWPVLVAMDVGFWLVLCVGASLLARWIAGKTRDRIRHGPIFAVLLGGLLAGHAIHYFPAQKPFLRKAVDAAAGWIDRGLHHPRPQPKR